MIKRVNFTGRKRISKSCAEIEVFDGSPRTFEAQIDLSATKMPADAKVFIEAMSAGSSVIKRFDFGTVGQRQTPSDLSLGEIEGENVFFALKVVDIESDRFGRIIGLAENIRPERAGQLTATGRQGILPIDERPLGQELWRLDLSNEHEAYLFVNSEVPGLKERAKYDPLFFATVYPAVIRLILGEALERGDIDSDDDHWPTLWLKFGQSLHPEHENPPPRDIGDEEWKEWIDAIVEAFADSHRLKDHYVKSLPQSDGDDA